MEFTKEEISLCKQIAGKHRKDISDGDWIYHEPHNNYFLVVQHVILQYQLQTQKWFDELNAIHRKMNIPLWTISDCLEFLRKNVHQADIGQIKDEMPDCYIYDGLKGTEKTYTGKTPLEACLKAVLAVLEEVPSGQVDK